VAALSSEKSESSVLVCFAVKEEAKFFVADACQTIVTGMGVKNASKGILEVLSKNKPALVLTTGFAGGLNPKLKVGDVVFEEDAEAGLRAGLIKLNAVPVRFHCASKVAVTAADKEELWKATGADVVEMESSAIRKISRQHGIPSATIRVISDAAGEDLPLDFNALMTPDDRIDFAKLALKLISGPQKIPQLIRFQKQTSFAARNLAEVLQKLLVARGA
jgi:adenosylhomocysteine nucleosidase